MQGPKGANHAAAGLEVDKRQSGSARPALGGKNVRYG
jgi:hypothetical protein